MKYKENWALSVERIMDFFSREFHVTSWEKMTVMTDAANPAGTEYHARTNDTRIILRPLADSLILKIPIQRTEIEIEGPDAEAESLHHKFLMNFLSAGG